MPRRAASDKPAVEKAAKTIEFARVRNRQLTHSIKVPATLIAEETAPLMPRISAYVSKVHADIGDVVSTGQVLIELDAPEYQQRVRRQQSVLDQRLAEVTLAEAKLSAAQSQQAAKQAMVNLRSSERARIEQLTSQGMLTGARRDEALQGEEEARAMLASSESGIAVAAAEVDNARAEVEVARAELSETQSMVDYLTIAAPFDGVITQRMVDPGVFVQPTKSMDSKPLLTLANISKLRAVVHLTRENAPKVQTGNPAKLQFTGIDEPIEGTLARVSGALDPDTRMLRAEIDIDNGDRRLKAGSYAAAHIILEQANQLSVPAKAVIGSGSGATVMKLSGDRAQRKSVELGIQQDGLVGIRSGLSEGDRVIAMDPGSYENNTTVSGILREVEE